MIKVLIDVYVADTGAANCSWLQFLLLMSIGLRLIFGGPPQPPGRGRGGWAKGWVRGAQTGAVWGAGPPRDPNPTSINLTQAAALPEFAVEGAVKFVCTDPPYTQKHRL